jgi:hypothetical protein
MRRRTRGAGIRVQGSAFNLQNAAGLRLVLLVVWLFPCRAPAQATGPPPVAEGTAADKAGPPQARDLGPGEKLVLQQQALADKYKQLEEVLLRMSELSAATDPRRAALLKKAVGQSKERLIGAQFEALVELLRKEQLSRASESQEHVAQDLRALLELLLSENRAQRIESEKARIREYLKRLNLIINQQKDLQGRTGGAGEPKQLSGEQGELARSAGDLAEQIKSNEESEGEQGQAKKEQGSEGAKKPSEGKPEEAKQGGEKTPPGGKDRGPQIPGEKGTQGREDKPSPADQSHGARGQKEQQPGRQGGDRQGQQGRRDSSQSGQDQPQDGRQHPARKRLEAARQRMQEARQKLDQAQKEGAIERQEEAIRELEQAKADLERILRQLREEEIGQVLTMLEARFVKMLQMQRGVYEGTQRLDKASQGGMTREQEIEASRLSSQEADIVLEAEKALALLREEGSAVAFPEAVTQMRDDMRQVVSRLSQAKVERITQSIEEDIISVLEEMITALQQAIKDADQRRQQAQQDPPQGEPQDPKLVDTLAELKMIRAMQMRVNSRTERYSRLLQGEQAENRDLLEALDRLAEEEQRIYRITRDLQVGRNR